MTKQEAIQKAYGEQWDTVKDHVNENGWCDLKAVHGGFGNSIGLRGLDLECFDSYHPKYCYWKRPISISGIEENNGWTRIESEADLPDYGRYYIYTDNGFWDIAEYSSNQHLFIASNVEIEVRFVTHYQPIQKPKPPIY